MPGVGIGPTSSTSTPIEQMPDAIACLEHVAGEARVLADEDLVPVIARLRKTWATARPSESAISAVMG